MCPGLTTNLQQIDDAGKTTVIDRELSRLNIDVACLQETRMADSGTLRGANYTFFWQRKPPGEPRLHGVGFATPLAFAEPPVAGTERILVLCMLMESGPANIISVYAPTLCSPPEEKDAFYEVLDEMISGIPNSEAIYLLGDFNARVGADHGAWPSCLGVHGRGKTNDNGQRLLKLCCFHGLCVMNTFFKCRHPSSVLETPALMALASA